MLTTTFDSFFRGEKELFEGLKIMDYEQKWESYPVIHLDLSSAKGQESPAELRDKLTLLLKPYKEEYGSDPDEKTPGGVLAGLIRRAYNVQAGFALKFWRALKKGDVELAMREMQAYMAGIPYVEGFKKKLEEAATAEGFYEYTMYLIFSMLNVYVRTQVKCSGGRVDMVVWMPDTIYVFELKVRETATEALQQIDNNSYAIPYQTDVRQVVKVGVKFDAEKRVPVEWVIS